MANSTSKGRVPSAFPSLTKKMATKNAMEDRKSPPEKIGVQITKEQLCVQDPSNNPGDWDTPGKYHPFCASIWTAWLVFVLVFADKQTIDRSTLQHVPPLLLWEARPEMSLICLLMHYMPTKLTNSVKGGLHPASAEHSNGTLISSSWQLVKQSVGSLLFKV